MPARPVIYHRVAKLEGIDPNLLNHRPRLLKAVNQLAKELKLHVLKKFVHRFEPHGISIVWVIGESHLAIHTWPEYGFLHFDIVSCAKEADLSNLSQALKNAFRPTSLTCRKVS